MPRPAAAGGAGLPLEQALWPLVRWLTEGKMRRADVTVSAQGIAVQTTSVYGRRVLTWNDVAVYLHAQRDEARPPVAAWLEPTAFTRWSVLLPLVGQSLDRLGVRDCVIQARVAPTETPWAWSVRVVVDGKTVLDTGAVRRRLRRLRMGHGTRGLARLPLPAHSRWAILRHARPLPAVTGLAGGTHLPHLPRPSLPVTATVSALAGATARVRARLHDHERAGATETADVCGYMLPPAQPRLVDRARRLLAQRPPWAGATRATGLLARAGEATAQSVTALLKRARPARQGSAP